MRGTGKTLAVIAAIVGGFFILRSTMEGHYADGYALGQAVALCRVVAMLGDDIPSENEEGWWAMIERVTDLADDDRVLDAIDNSTAYFYGCERDEIEKDMFPPDDPSEPAWIP